MSVEHPVWKGAGRQPMSSKLTGEEMHIYDDAYKAGHMSFQWEAEADARMRKVILNEIKTQ